MKKPTDMAEKAFLLGQAWNYCKKIDDIFAVLFQRQSHGEGGKIQEPIHAIEDIIEKALLVINE
jgi:hypothetical protein